MNTSLPAKYRYIVVEGPIGVGKTSLVVKLAEVLNGRVLLEEPGGNPFLPGFYQDPSRYGLSAQLFFLLQRVNQVRDLSQSNLGSGVTFADFMLDKDPLFAAINLDDAEFKLYDGIYKHLRPHAPVPDLVLYLQATPEILIERVRRRRVEFERGITLEYLTKLSDAYARYFHDYTGAPMLVVNSENLNFVDREGDFELLLSRVRGLKSAREYFSVG
jgi:deoxyadenosine/deoxycytidine kinase